MNCRSAIVIISLLVPSIYGELRKYAQYLFLFVILIELLISLFKQKRKKIEYFHNQRR